MHSLAVLVVPNDAPRARIRPLAVRDAALSARIDTLLFRFEQPEERAWGVDHAQGARFDWCVIGGRWAGWGRRVRQLMRKQNIEPLRTPIPKFVERDAVWSGDLIRVRTAALAEYPLAVITPHGDWVDCPSVLPAFWKPTPRERKARTGWLKTIGQIMDAYPDCLVIAVDYHD